MVSRLWLREASLRSNFVTPLPGGRGNFLGRAHCPAHSPAFYLVCTTPVPPSVHVAMRS